MILIKNNKKTIMGKFVEIKKKYQEMNFKKGFFFLSPAKKTKNKLTRGDNSQLYFKDKKKMAGKLLFGGIVRQSLLLSRLTPMTVASNCQQTKLFSISQKWNVKESECWYSSIYLCFLKMKDEFACFWYTKKGREREREKKTDSNFWLNIFFFFLYYNK